MVRYSLTQDMISLLTRKDESDMKTGGKQVFNKYYFIIAGKNGFTLQFSDKKLTVDQHRGCWYNVS